MTLIIGSCDEDSISFPAFISLTLNLTLSSICIQSEFIHFVDGYLIAPGYIDLSDLRFSATDAEYQDYEDDDDTFEDDGNGGGRRTQSRKLSSAGDDDNSNAGLETGTALDIAVFHLVSETDDDPPGQTS